MTYFDDQTSIGKTLTFFNKNFNVGTLLKGFKSAKFSFRDSIKYIWCTGVRSGICLKFFDTQISIQNFFSFSNKKFDVGTLSKGFKDAKFHLRDSIKYGVLVLGVGFFVDTNID